MRYDAHPNNNEFLKINNFSNNALNFSAYIAAKTTAEIAAKATTA